eukprot:TRINITY_DN7779_c0_g1_i2.p1 TRINITY_DN7779_c0_g1~~TRINITY_DN7779_c0_g1_i2.p1  ORF type:complete len:640 (+),score=131.06 TRINITY_DN7779_c0_g1_i2:2-1921(+)
MAAMVNVVQELPWELIALNLSLRDILSLSATCRFLNHRLKQLDFSHRDSFRCLGCNDVLLECAAAWPLMPINYAPRALRSYAALLESATAMNLRLYGLHVNFKSPKLEPTLYLFGQKQQRWIKPADFLAAMLSSSQLENIRSLRLIEPKISNCELEVWHELFQTMTSLEKLELIKPTGNVLYLLAMPEIARLKVVKLESVRRSVDFPMCTAHELTLNNVSASTLPQLPSLRSLRLTDVHRVELSDLNHLTQLWLDGVLNLPNDTMNLPQLRKLTVNNQSLSIDAPKLKHLSADNANLAIVTSPLSAITSLILHDTTLTNCSVTDFAASLRELHVNEVNPEELVLELPLAKHVNLVRSGPVRMVAMPNCQHLYVSCTVLQHSTCLLPQLESLTLDTDWFSPSSVCPLAPKTRGKSRKYCMQANLSHLHLEKRLPFHFRLQHVEWSSQLSHLSLTRYPRFADKDLKHLPASLRSLRIHRMPGLTTLRHLSTPGLVSLELAECPDLVNLDLQPASGANVVDFKATDCRRLFRWADALPTCRQVELNGCANAAMPSEDHCVERLLAHRVCNWSYAHIVRLPKLRYVAMDVFCQWDTPPAWIAAARHDLTMKLTRMTPVTKVDNINVRDDVTLTARQSQTSVFG